MAAINERRARALNRWARGRGYADFDTFIRVGGSIAEACEDIDHRIAMLEDARVALGRYGDNQPEDWRPADSTPNPAIGPDALAAAEADVVGEPVDTDNAQIQGFDHASD
jgi:hypothetical protein